MASPPPAGAPPPPPPSPAPTGRPIGKPRSIGLVILLSIVTLGIWMWVWSYQNGDELKRYSGKGVGGGGYLALMVSNIFLAGIPGVVVMFMMASEVEQLYRNEGREPSITTIWGLWFLLPIIGNIIWYVRIQKSINEFWVSHGSTVSPGL
jgi:hypothetical protein